MPTKLEGAQRIDAFRFEGEEIAKLAEFPQIGRFGGGLNEEHVHYLATSIAARGQDQPVLVRKRADGKPELIAGRHRKAAVLLINSNPSAFVDGQGVSLRGPVYLKAIFREMSEDEALLASFGENSGLPLTCMDLAWTAHNLSRLDWPAERIAAAISAPHHRVSPARVSQLRTLIRLPNKIQRALHAGEMSEGAARGMLKLGLDQQEMLDLADLIALGKVSSSEISARVVQQRRAEGRAVKRTIADLRAKLAALNTDPALDLLAWLDGETGDDAIDHLFLDAPAGPRRVASA